MIAGDLEKSSEFVTAPKTPLLLGRYTIAPQALFRILLFTYAAFFIVYRLVDVVFFLTVDGRFPDGLNYQYTSDYERLQTVAYTRQMLRVSMISNTLTFCVVLAFVCTPALINLDAFVRKSVLKVKGWTGYCPWCITAPFSCAGRCCSCILEPFQRLMKCCLCGWEPQWEELFYGAIFLTIIAAFFAALSAPFKLWRYSINVEFGFANVLTTSSDQLRASLGAAIVSSIIYGWPSLMLYLAVLKCRFGWLLMWVGLCLMTLVALHNVESLAPMVFDATAVFPNHPFGVGTQFSLSGIAHNVSLNRIYYPTSSKQRLVTHDHSRGPLELVSSSSKGDGWVIREANSHHPKTFAETERSQKIYSMPESGDDHLEKFETQTWQISGLNGPAGDHGMEGHIGMRDGQKLRKELLDFAKEQGIDISEVYMIDGSYKDSRANAFAAGAGGGRIIGLYDTLFLGDPPLEDELSLLDAPPPPVESRLSIQGLSKLVRGVSVKDPTLRKVRRSTPVVAMTDDEILAIMGHELGHSAMKHSEWGIVEQSLSSFWSFAILGWIVHCPVIAAAFGFGAPVAHIALFLYNHVVTPPMESVIGLVNDAITRKNEYAADAYAARVSKRYATNLQTALQKLTVNSNADPTEPWFYEMLHDDHPTTAKRWARIEQLKRELYPDDEDDAKLLANAGASDVKRTARKGQ